MFVEPHEMVGTLDIPTGALVADFGCGGGAHTLAVAKQLKGTGRVYGIDVQKNLLVRLKHTATNEGIGNLDVIWGDIERVGGSTLRDQSIDYVFLSNVLFLTPEKETVLKEARRVLRAGGNGHLLLIDWASSLKGIAPGAGAPLTDRDARALAEKAGFIFEKTVDAGAYHYGLLFHT